MTKDLSVLHPKPLSPAKFAHFVLCTTELEKTRDWYLKVLNAKVAFENHMCCFIAYDDEHHRVGIVKFPDLQKPAPRTTGVEHVAFTFDQLSELLVTYRRLKGEGIVPVWGVIHGPTVSLYYKDPAGIKVELQYDVFRTNEEINEFFAGGSYEENFVGVTFDPDDMAARFESGVPLAELVKRPPLPPGMSPWEMVPAALRE